MKVKIIKFIFTSLFLFYLLLYVNSITGYYEYKNYEKVRLTDEEIEKFESDIASGKEIDLYDYVINENKSYNNKISDFGKRLSFNLRDIFKSILTFIFKYLSKFITD